MHELCKFHELIMEVPDHLNLFYNYRFYEGDCKKFVFTVSIKVKNVR